MAYPEMRRFGYPQSFATGVIAAGGTLGAMLPPSTVLAVYGIITEQDIGKLFMAGIVPGLLAMTMYMVTITLIGFIRPDFLPRGPAIPWRDRFAGLRRHANVAVERVEADRDLPAPCDRDPARGAHRLAPREAAP